MGTVTVTTAAAADRAPTRRRAVLRSGSTTLVLPITSPETSIDLGGQWSLISRPGRDALLRYAGPKPYVITLEVTLYSLNGVSTLKAIRAIEAMSKSLTPVAVSYGTSETGTFRITSFRPKITKRATLNYPTEASATIELTRVVAEHLVVPARTAPTKPPKKKSTGTSRRTVRYTVKRGDTLIKIASKVCHSSGHWQRIARDNKIRDPRKLQVGKRLTITCL